MKCTPSSKHYFKMELTVINPQAQLIDAVHLESSGREQQGCTPVNQAELHTESYHKQTERENVRGTPQT